MMKIQAQCCSTLKKTVVCIDKKEAIIQRLMEEKQKVYLQTQTGF